MPAREKLFGIACALAGALCFSVSGTLQALAPEGVTPFVVAESRAIIGALFLFLWCLVTKRLPKALPLGFLKQAAVCAFWISIAQVTFFWGAFKIGVATSTTIDLAMSPVGAALLAWWFAGKRPSLVWFLSTALALAGVVCIGGGLRTDVNVGLLVLPVIGGLSYAVYLLENQSLPKDVAPEACIMTVLAVVSVLLSPALILCPVDWVVSSPRGLFVVVAIGVVTAGMAFPLTLSGVRRLSVPVAATLGLAEPLGATMLGLFVLHEDANPCTILGIVMLFAALIGLVRAETRSSTD